MSDYEPVAPGARAAKHPKAIDLFREWADAHEPVRVFVRQDEIIEYQRKLNAFIDRAERDLAMIKNQNLASVRFRDSITALEGLIGHARNKREFFDGRFVTLGRESNTFAREMTFDEQKMVAQHRDFGNIKAKIDEISRRDRLLDTLTESQAWALVAADARGKVNQWANCELAINRLQGFNKRWSTSYGMADLVLTWVYMTKRTQVATQYRLEQEVGGQQGRSGGSPLYKLLMQSGFKNVWETGTSQASDDLTKRGAVEERMGYGSAVGRKSGKAQDYNDGSGTFAPESRAEIPRYAGTIAAAQQHGVAQRYGTSYIVWKDKVRNRVTWTPGDSWSFGAEGPQSVKNYVSLDHPEVIFVHAEENLIRMFMAEATNKDQEWLKKVRGDSAAFAQGGAYIETQIHGSLTWSDVGAVVLDSGLKNLDGIKAEFESFKRDKGLDFVVRTTPHKVAKPAPTDDAT